MNLEELVDRTTVFAHLRQQHFERSVGDRIWWLDPQNGKARLHDPDGDRAPGGPLLDVQLLGTEGGGEWLWAWDNPISFLLPHTFHLATHLRDMGRRDGIPELATGRLPTDALVNARVLGAVAMAVGNFGGYVVHGAGELVSVFLVPASYPTGEEEATGDLNLLARTCSELASSAETLTSGRHLVEGAFHALGLPMHASEDTLVGTNARGQTLTATFVGTRMSIRTDEPPARAPADGPFFTSAHVALAFDKGRLVVRPAGDLDIFAHMRALRFTYVLTLYLGADRILMARVEDAGDAPGEVVVALHGAFARESSGEPTSLRYVGPLPLDEARAIVHALDAHLGLPRRAPSVTDAELDEHPERHARTFVQVDGTWTTGHERCAMGRSWVTFPRGATWQGKMHEHGSSARNVLAFFHADGTARGYGHMNVYPSELEVLEMDPGPEIAHREVR